MANLLLFAEELQSQARPLGVTVLCVVVVHVVAWAAFCMERNRR